MKSLILSIIICSSSYAFSETREEHSNAKNLSLNAQLVLQGVEVGADTAAGAFALIKLKKNLATNPSMSEMAKTKNKTLTGKKLITSRNAKIALLATASGYILKEIENDASEYLQMADELKKIEDDSRNDREKTSSQSKKTNSSQIVSVQKD